ncbi:MAG: hypothetical protein MSA57_02670, partial [Ruminococcus sp.]|nr:hypothetical protein [Ruminococcus sp.]
MTQGGKKMEEIRKTSCIKRVISMLLAVLMILVSVPISSLTASAWGGPGFGGFGGWGRPGWGQTPDVMTNVRAEFTDTSYHGTSEQESGELFYLYLSLAGNNVNHWGRSTTYRIDIPENLLLPDFPGQGLRDGAKYSGFTMHVEGNSRYLTYDIANGQTKAIYLKAKFANGKTPNGEQATVKITASGSGQSKTSTVTAKSKIAWDDSKSAGRDTISLSQLSGNNEIPYTLKAYPNYTSTKKGEWWVGAVEMTDVITLPDGLTFKDGASDIREYLTLPDDIEIKSASASGNTLSVTWVKTSTNTDAEMAPYTVNAALKTNMIEVGNFTSGKIHNDLTVRVQGVNSTNPDQWETLPKKSADVAISTPAPAKIDLSKSVAATAGDDAASDAQYYSSKGYLVCGEYVLFKVEATNSGETAKGGTLTLTDVVPAGLTPVSGVTVGGHETDGTINGQTVTWTKEGLGVNETFTGYVVCKVDDNIITSMQSVRNAVYLGTPEQYESVAAAYVNIKKPSSSFSIAKSVDKSIYSVGDTLTYTITVSNTGEEDITFSSLTDAFNDETNLEIDKSNLPTGSFELAVGKTKTFEIPVTVKEGKTGDITNTATATPEGGTPQSASATASQNAFSFGDGQFTKNVSSTVAIAKGSITYTLKYYNNSRYSGKYTENDPLTFTDDFAKLNDLTVGNITVKLNGKEQENPNIQNVNGKVTVKYVGDVPAYGSVTVDITCQIAKGASGTIPANTATLSHGSDAPLTDDSDEVKISDVSLDVDKWAIVDNETSVSSANNAKDFYASIPTWGESLKSDSLIQDKIGEKTYGTVLPGQRVVYYIKVTNTGKDTIKDLDITDTLKDTKFADGNATNIYVVETGGGATYRNIGVENGWTADESVGSLSKWAASQWNIHDKNQHEVYIPENGYYVFAYALIAPDGFNAGSNEVSVDTTGLTTPVKDSIQYQAASPQLKLEKSFAGNKKDETQKIDAVLTNGTFDYDKTLASLKDLKFQYNLKLINQSHIVNLYSDDITIKDTMPEGMEFVSMEAPTMLYCYHISAGQDSSGTTWNNNDMHNWNMAQFTATVDGQKVIFAPIDAAKFYMLAPDEWNASSATISYTTKLTDTKAAEIATMLQKQYAENSDLVSVTLTNTGKVETEKEVLIDGKPGKVATDTADLTLKQVIKKTAPGLTKAASDVKATRKSNDGINIPTWIITVSNDDDADAPMTNIVLEDELSGGMQYAAGAKLDSDLSKNFNGYSTDDGKTWNDLDSCVTVNGSKFTIELPKDVQLQPGQSVQIRYAADDPNLATDELVPEKTYFNKTTLSTSEKIYQDRVTAGDLVDGKLEATASNSQGGVETTSFKTISFDPKNIDEQHKDGWIDNSATGQSDGYGQGNTPNDNYVKGLQGKQVEYKIYVTNDSTTKSLKNFTVIDRLPFENVDIGLVSGYDRYSAFTVIPDLSSVTYEVGTLTNTTDARGAFSGTEVQGVKVSYSSDKHSSLDEHAGDWMGESGNMNWQDTPTSEIVNLRFQFPSTFEVDKGQTVCITFKGTIPDYVQNTGEENIAWNSFAYSYQYLNDKNELVETPMVAEPAKVGVWVPEVKDTVSLVVNKKYESGQGDTQTFYFALFTAKTDGVTPTYGADGKLTNASEFTRYSSEIKPITVKDGEIETATFTNIPASAKKNLYVFETDENGVIKDNVNVAVGTPDSGTDAKTLNPSMPESAASGDSGTKLTYKDEDTVAAVSFLNEIQYGKITVEKTFKSPFNTTDTFYFGLFYKTKDGAYVKYGDLQTVTLTGSKTGATDTVTFDEVPIQRNWYVLETDAKGNPVTDSYLDYKVTYGDSAGKDHAIKLDDVNVPKTAKITNEESATYQIQATKVVNGEALTNESGTYRFALYSSDKEELTNDDLAGLTMVGTPQDVAAGKTVTFDNLKENTYYYLFELDSDGNILKQGDKATNGKTGYIVEYPNADTRETTDAETNTTTSTVYYLPTQFGKTDADEPLTVDDCIKQSAIQNREQTKAVTGSITVDKTVLQNSTKLTDWEFYVGLYVQDAEGNLKLYGDVSESVHTLTKDAPSTVFENLPAKTDAEPDAGMYYVAECDKDGNPFSDGTNGNYTIYYNVNGSDSAAVYGAVLLDGRFDTAPTGAVSVTNKTVSVTRTLVKKDLADKDGAALTGAKFAIYTKLAYEAYQNGQETTLSAIQENITDKITANLAENTEYVLVETTAPENYAIMNPIFFTVNANGQIVLSDNTREDVDFVNGGNDTSGYTSELTAYDSKESTIIIGKYDITKQTELAGATLTLTSENDVDWSKVTLENSTAVLDENKKQIGIQWISTGTDAVIKGLPDGDYTLAETGSEFTSETDGKTYKVAEGTATFTLTDGTIANTTGTTDTVDADAADSYFYYNRTKSNISLAVCDAVIGTTIIINKHDIDTEESSRVNLPDAKMKLTPQEGQTIDLSEITLTDGNVLTQTRDSIIWTTTEFISAKLENVPDGKYFLTEVAAPNGYTVVTAFSFEVKGGKVITASREDGSITVREDENIISVNDKRTEVSISKVDAANDEELPGATLTLTNKDLTAEQWEAIVAVNTDLKTLGNGVQWTSGDAAKNIVGLPTGTYTLTETAAPNGYAYSEDITFVIGSDGKVVDKTTGADLNGTVVMKDYRAELTISKKDGSDAFLAGATLQLLSKTTDPLNLDDVQIDGKPLTEDQKVTVDGRQGIQFVSTNAEMKITGLPAIEYELSEVSAPTDYLKSSDVQNIDLTKAIFDDEGNQIPVSQKVINNKLGELTIQKVDQDGNDLTGATLKLKADDANVDWSSVKLNGNAVADLISAEDATVLVWTSTGESMTFKGLPAGTYEVSEVSAKAGYLAKTQKWAVTVSANGAISVNNQVSTDGQDSSIITITNEASTIQINKEALDGGSIAAEEAEFRLTAKDENATLNGVQIGETTITEDTISATFKGNVTISALPDGTYELEEITAPRGFKTISTFTFVVTNGVVTTVDETTNGEVEKSEDGKTLTIKDERTKIQIDKKDITGQEEVAGATLTLTNDDLT